MSLYKFFETVRDNCQLVIEGTSAIGQELWADIIKLHPADIAELFSYLDDEDSEKIFMKLPQALQSLVFSELSDSQKQSFLAIVSESDRSYLLSQLPLTELTDFLDELSDDELKEYLKLLHKRERIAVLSLLKFPPESAGGIMDTAVLSLKEDFTVEKSIQILQRLQPSKDLHQKIFVTDAHNKLAGNIHLEDLVLKNPKSSLKSIMRPSPMVIVVDQDQEEVAKRMIHYSETIAPVIAQNGTFLGVITSEALIKVLGEEASEDIYRMSAVVPIKDTYFQTPFIKLFYQRTSILIVLLLMQTLSSIIIEYYQVLLAGFLSYFFTMLISAGGNASSQTSALAIQGMAAGEINPATSKRFIIREIVMAGCIALLLAIFSFIRTFLTHGNFLGSLAVSLSLGAIVIVSIGLGACMPFFLKRLNMDPAHSAGPLLATLMDVIGILIYCFISQRIIPS